MKNLLTACIYFILFATSQVLHADDSVDDFYSRAFGDSDRPGVVFIHGGPGYNSGDFEISTAQKLADKGFYVVVYDQRGQGRSQRNVKRKVFNYTQYSNDLMAIIKKYDLKDVTLLAHSHGGPIAAQFDSRYPEVAKRIVIIAGVLNFNATANAIIQHRTEMAKLQDDQDTIDKLDQLKIAYNNKWDGLLDSERIDHNVKLFEFSSQMGNLEMTKAAKILYRRTFDDPQYMTIRRIAEDTESMPGFLVNEHYELKNYIPWLQARLSQYEVPGKKTSPLICGIFGANDHNFTQSAYNEISSSFAGVPNGAQRFVILPKAGHPVYIEQQDLFMGALQTQCQMPMTAAEPN